MAGARHTHRCRSSSASDVEKRRSSRYGSVGSSSRKRRRRSDDFASAGYHHGRESQPRGSTSSRKRGRKGRSRVKKDDSYGRAGETEGTRSSSRAGSGGKLRTEGAGKALPCSNDVDREIHERREKRHSQHQASGRRRRRSSGGTHNSYGRYDDQDTFALREGGRSSRYDTNSSSRYESRIKRYENDSNRRHDNRGSASDKYNNSGKYGNNSSRSARDDGSSSWRCREYNSSRYVHNNSSRCMSGGTGGMERDRKRHEGSDGGSHGEECNMRGEHRSSRYAKSSTSKHGAYISSGEFGDGAPTGQYSGGSRYARNLNSSNGLYGSAYSSRDAIDSGHDGERWRRVASIPHAADRQMNADERRRKHQVSSRSAGRERSPREQTAAPEKGRRHRGVAAVYEETGPAKSWGSRTAGVAPGGERRRRSLDIEEDGLHKKQRTQAAAATIGSRASFLRSNAPPGVPRIGGASAYDTERGKEEIGHDMRDAVPRETRREDILEPPLRNDKRDIERLNARMDVEKSKRGGDGSKHHDSHQQAHDQRKKEGEQEQQGVEWERQSSQGERQHADATEREKLQKKRTYTCTSGPRSGPRGACTRTDTEEDLQQQLQRESGAREGAVAQRRDASAERHSLELRTSAGENVNETKEVREEQQLEKKELHPMERGAALKKAEGSGAFDKLCSSGHVPNEGGEQHMRETGRKDNITSACSSREHRESEQTFTQLKKQMSDDMSRPGEKAATPAGRPDEQTAAAVETLARRSGALDAAVQKDGEAIAELEEGAASERKDEVVSKKEDVGAGEVELTVAAIELPRRENDSAGRQGTKWNAVAEAADLERDEGILGAGGTEPAAIGQSEMRTTNDPSFSPSQMHIQPAGNSRDGVCSGEAAAGDEEAEGSEASGDSSSLVCPPSVMTHKDAGSLSGAGRRSPSTDSTAAAAGSIQSYVKESAVGAATRNYTAAATAQASSPTSTEVSPPGTEGALTREGEVVVAEGQVSEGARASAVAWHHGSDRRQDKEVEGNGGSRAPQGGESFADATPEGEGKTTPEAVFSTLTAAAGRRGERTLSRKGESRFAAAVVEAMEEREQEHQQTVMEAYERRRTITSYNEMQPSDGSWRVVTLDSRNKSGVGAGGVRLRDRESSSSSGEGCRQGAEGSARKRGRDEERRQRAGAEERHRIMYRVPASFHSPTPQKHTPPAEYSQRPYFVRCSSSSSSRVPLRHNYSPSLPYSPSRDLSPGPYAVPFSAAYSKSSSSRTVQFSRGGCPSNVASCSRAAAFPRTLVAPPPQFAPHGSAAPAHAARSRRGESAFFLLQERSAAGVSPGMRCGIHSTTPSARPAAAPLAGPYVAQQQRREQYGRKNSWNPYAASGTPSFPLTRPEERPPLGEAALSKLGAGKDPRRKEDFKWAHDLFEQVARAPEKTRRRFNLYSENLEIAE